MQNNSELVFTINELSNYLKIPKSTLYKLVRAGKVPGQKIGRHWRFRKIAVDNWLEDFHPETSKKNNSMINPFGRTKKDIKII